MRTRLLAVTLAFVFVMGCGSGGGGGGDGPSSDAGSDGPAPDGGSVGLGCADPSDPESEGSESAPVLIPLAGGVPYVGGIDSDQGPSFYRFTGLKQGARYLIHFRKSSAIGTVEVFQSGFSGKPSCSFEYDGDTLECEAVPQGESMDLRFDSPIGGESCFTLDAVFDSPKGAFEGAWDALKELRIGSPDLPHRGIVDHRRSYYRLTELTPGKRYTVWVTGPEKEVNLVVGAESPDLIVDGACQDSSVDTVQKRSCSFTAETSSRGVMIYHWDSVTSSRYVLSAFQEVESEGTSAAPKVLPFAGGIVHDGRVGPATTASTPNNSYYQITGLTPGKRYLAALTDAFKTSLFGFTDAGFAAAANCNNLGSSGICDYLAVSTSLFLKVPHNGAHGKKFTLHVHEAPVDEGGASNPKPLAYPGSFPYAGQVMSTSEYLVSSLPAGAYYQVTLLDAKGPAGFQVWPADAQTIDCGGGGSFFPRCTLKPSASGQLRIRAGGPGAFTLGLEPAPALESVFVHQATVPIPNGIATGITDTLVVAGSPVTSIQRVKAEIYVKHGRPLDLSVKLVAPDGVTEVLLAPKNQPHPYEGVVYDDYMLEDLSGLERDGVLSRRPGTPLYVLEGASANGSWTLKLVDDENPNIANNDGELLGWGLSFE